MYEEDDEEMDDAETKDDKSFKTLLSKVVGTDEDETQAKYFGLIDSAFPDTSFEDMLRAVHSDLAEYLEYKLDDVDKYDWVEAYPIKTYSDHVIVYCWNTDSLYKATYEVEDGEVEFTDLTLITLSYQESDIDMKAILENADDELATTV